MDKPSKRTSKAKRKPKQCPNPLFLQWLERWRDEAKSKESKMQYVYSKAISSLKKYPLPLESGKEATLLDGIGPSIAKRLDEELVKHQTNLCSSNEMVVDLGEDIGGFNFSDLRVPPPVAAATMVPSTSANTGSSSDDPAQPPRPKKKRKSSPREYIPMHRSGPYAIVITLHQASQRVANYKGYMTKAELLEQAQLLSDASFTVPEPDSYYTAWSSMSTLVKKGFVLRAGNPARFSLSDSGHVLANKLLTANENYNACPSSPSYLQASPSSNLSPNPNFSPSTASALPSFSTKETSKNTKKATSKKTQAKTAKVSEPTQPQTFPKSRKKLSAADFIDVTPSSYPNKSKDFLSSYNNRVLGTDVKMNQTGSLQFWFVDSDGQCVEHDNKAAVIIDDEIGGLGFLIKCKLSDLEKANMKYKLDHSKTGDNGYVFVFVASECLTNNAIVENNPPKKKDKVSNPTNNSSDDSDDDILMRPLFQRLTKDSDVVITGIGSERNTKVNDDTPVVVEELASAPKSQRIQLANVNSGYKPELPKSQCKQPAKITGNREPEVPESQWNQPPAKATTSREPQLQKSQCDQPPKVTSSREPEIVKSQWNQPTMVTSNHELEIPSIAPTKEVVPLFELKPDSYDIILCVDFVEITGGGKTARKDEMVKELKMNGVQFDVRKLNVGDFLWVAREKAAPRPGQLAVPLRQELVLDYIIERKRMDDLCSSIKDGRFKEQKFRLLNSGLRNPVYLVEEFGSVSFLSMPAQTLEQAIVNTQVGQDFFIKRTRDIKESAAYLTLMTRYLQNAYRNKTLKAINKDDMEFVNENKDEPKTFLMTFQELNDISVKNRVLTVGELFGKQLLQIPGVAVEKVVGILESYPTLRHLLDAYKEQKTEKEKEELLSGIKYGKTQRKVGPSVSKLVYSLYCTKGALS